MSETSPSSGRPLSMAIVTPSYARDMQLCAELNESVLKYCAPHVVHHVIVPEKDLRLFAPLAGDRTMISGVNRQLPGHILKLLGVNAWINTRNPYPPLRGWIVQQLVKLAFTASLATDIALLTDSDILFIDQVGPDAFSRMGTASFYRLEKGVDDTLPRHRQWHEVAHRLLGLDAPSTDLLPDYISWPCPWNPAIVRELLDQVSAVAGKHWTTVIGREVHFSEMILYGVYVDQIYSSTCTVYSTNSMRCLNYSAELSMDELEIRTFLQGIKDNDVAVMISAKSGVDLDLRQRMLSRIQR